MLSADKKTFEIAAIDKTIFEGRAELALPFIYR
jgi:hypothetical protein